MSKIYVASSWKNKYQQDVVKFLKEKGHDVYDFKNPTYGNTCFSWSDSDFNGMKWAEICVMVLPCGRSANTEAGWMKGFGRKTI